MIDDVLIFLRNQVNAHLARPFAADGDGSVEDRVVFLDGEKMDQVSFKLGAVTLLMINVEEEPVLRGADPFSRVATDGSAYAIKPDVRVNLLVLFVARFNKYEHALLQLSRIIEFFQHHRVFDRRSAPTLSPRLERLATELITLPLSEQNDLWNALRCAYHPSVLYRVKTVIFKDQAGRPATPVGEAEFDVVHRDRAAV